MSEKLQKVLAVTGLGSRREIERWILQGRIKIDTRLAKLGDRIVPNLTRVSLDNKPIQLSTAPLRRRVLVLHKPEGEVCTRRDPENRPTVFSHLPPIKKQRWIMIGRLDINTSGLLLFTNDGKLAHCLAHPSYEIEREYAVRILGHVDAIRLKRLKSGVRLADGVAAFSQIKEQGGEGVNRWYHVVLKEGKNREVRRLFESQGIKVSRLIRIRFANIILPPKLRKGHFSELHFEDILHLDKLINQKYNFLRKSNEVLMNKD
jgi:23S rRNA pseudouridine2605 synthase